MRKLTSAPVLVGKSRTQRAARRRWACIGAASAAAFGLLPLCTAFGGNAERGDVKRGTSR